jgi:hypothetical protein
MSTTIGFQASWATRAERASFAHLIGPCNGTDLYDAQPPYIAVFIGGHGGVRVALDDPDDADALAQLLAAAAARFRAASETGEWDETSFTAADLDTDRDADEDAGHELAHAPVIAC